MKYITIIHFILFALLSSNTYAQLHPDMQDVHLSDSEFSSFKTLYYKITLRSADLSDNKKLIEQYKFAMSNFEANLGKLNRVPKVLHHVWLGDEPLPPLYSRNIAQCQELHPGWKYKIWTGKDIKSFPNSIQKLISESRGYHEQSDILRLAVLKKYGGVYLDADIKCLQSFDDLVEKYGEIVSIDYAKRRVLNGLIAAEPNSTLIDKALENLAINFTEKSIRFTEQKFDYANPMKSFHRLAVERTMMPLSDAVLSYDKLGLDPDFMVLPLSYCMKPFKLGLKESVKRFFGFYLEHSNGLEFYNFAKCYHNAAPSNSYLNFPKFELALGAEKQQYKAFIKGLFNLKNETKFYKYIYENNYPSIMPVQAKPLIPKIIHFVKGEPKNMQLWQAIFSNYQFKIWSKAMVEDLLEKNGFKNIADEQVANIIASLIVVNSEGGVVISDRLLVPTINIDDLVYQYNLFLTLDPLRSFGQNKLSISSNIFAAKRGNIFIDKLLIKIKKDLIEVKSDEQLMQILSEVIIENYPLDKKIFIFPASFFLSNNPQDSYTYYDKISS